MREADDKTVENAHVYAAAIAYRERTATAQWRAAVAPDGVDPMGSDMAEKRYKAQLEVERSVRSEATLAAILTAILFPKPLLSCSAVGAGGS